MIWELGKTVITLTAVNDLLFDSFEAHRILVIAPLRVARDTWPDELTKWEHLSHLRFSVAVGTETERKAALMQRADIHIINRENVQWLVEDSGIPWQWDMVVIDELSSFKSHQSKRFRSLLKMRPSVASKDASKGKTHRGTYGNADGQRSDGFVGGVSSA